MKGFIGWLMVMAVIITAYVGLTQTMPDIAYQIAKKQHTELCENWRVDIEPLGSCIHESEFKKEVETDAGFYTLVAAIAIYFILFAMISLTGALLTAGGLVVANSISNSWGK